MPLIVSSGWQRQIFKLAHRRGDVVIAILCGKRKIGKIMLQLPSCSIRVVR